MYKRFNAENMDKKTLSVWIHIYSSLMRKEDIKTIVRLNDFETYYKTKRTVQCVFCLEYVMEYCYYSFLGSTSKICICPKCSKKLIKQTFKEFNFNYDNYSEENMKLYDSLLDKYGYQYFIVEKTEGEQQ